jgi:hypothetical protein
MNGQGMPPDRQPRGQQDMAAAERQARELLAAGRFEEAEATMRPWLASGRGPLTFWKILVAAIRPQGKIGEALAIQEMLAKEVPGDFSTRFDLSETLLLTGNFERGWREYRYRYSLAYTTAIERHVQRPRWNGKSIPGKTLLIHDEQGFGDTFQFLRMVPWAKARSGAKVILEVNPASLSIARRCAGLSDGGCDIVARGTLPPAFDVHCEMMSLPMAMGLQFSDLPGTMPYLSPDPQRVEKWRKRLVDLPRPIIALVWAGRPTHFNDANRSLTLDALAPLARPDVSFVAIQKGPSAEQAATPPSGMNLLALSDEIEDFEDTAAILCVADLLLSVDSAPVHLAGALGRPVWTLLPFVPDWRWLLKREDTPWYPSMRLFRQTQRSDWGGVMTRVAAALGQFITDTRTGA